jgi:hypothetical protein
MKSHRAFPLALAFIVLYAAWQVACGGGAGEIQPPPPAPTITGLATSADALVGKAITLPFQVTGNPTSVTCSVSPGTCTVAFDDASVSYTGAAPSSGGGWTAALTLTATNAGGSATAKVAISLGEITGVTVSPNLVALAMNMTQVFTANVTGSGTFPSTVTWTVPPGMGSIGSDGTYTPPQGVQGFEQVTLTATAADGQTSGTATVNVGFAWVRYYAPEGLTDGGATAMALSSDGTELVVADNRAIPDSPDTAAGLLLLNTQTGELEDSNWTTSPTPSKLYSMSVDPATGTIYAAGYQQDSGTASREALVLKITPGDPLQVTTLASFQLGNVRTEIHVTQFYGGEIYLAVNSDYSPDGWSSGDFIVVLDASGNMTKSPINTDYNSVITGMYISPQWIYATGNELDQNGNIIGTYEGRYDPTTGEAEFPFVGGQYPPLYDSAVFQNAVGEVLMAGTVYYSAAQQSFEISGSDTSFSVNLFGLWDGDNYGSMNITRGVLLNPQGGLTVLGYCAQIGGSATNQTDGCVISWSGSQASGQYLSVIWKQRFDVLHMPGGISAAWWPAVYGSDGTLYLGGVGTDGRTDCGATSCSTAVIGKFVPPPGS